MSEFISSPGNTTLILQKYDIRLKKSLGQNFLIDTNILKKIAKASNADENDIILEIGSGLGSLTEILAPLVKNMVCVEVDPRLSAAFREVMAGSIESNITFIESDAMKIDYTKLIREFKINKVISNLPYKIAAPLIITILKYAPGVEKMYLTIQKDIADRLLAKTGDKNYSSYTVKSVFLADFKKMFYIPRTCFMPVPKVDSVFIEVCRKDMKDSKICSVLVDDFFSFIENCFLHRRKKLVNSLQKILEKYNIDKKDLMVKMLHGIGKDADVRAEELTLDDFIKLFLALNIPKF
ncbi:MAG TPA: 16S rRNA (adenine(1518)-N(6)/adenine(1519)-N(6))-dimethyltransferase RsmA [Candidatus Humimicrobiaceae bacterium]